MKLHPSYPLHLLNQQQNNRYMTLSLFAYSAATWMLEPFAGILLKKRLKAGKERKQRLPERYGRTNNNRPPGKLIWMHGASVGETSMLLNLFDKLKSSYDDHHLLITSQTLTSADMISVKAGKNVIHQMAPMDGPRSVDRFLSNWQPDIAIFAEGEIWPNLIRKTNKRNTPLFLINARMTQKTLNNWKRRSNAAKKIFNCFYFTGAADEQTAQGIKDILGYPPDAIGNLKRAIEPPKCDPAELEKWQTSLANRQCLLAASTHAGEEVLALSAFQIFKQKYPDALLILVPRHPERAPEIIDHIKSYNLSFEQRSYDKQTACAASVLFADTIGEMGLWLRLANSVYLGGANKPDVGGHNPIEPLKLRKTVFSGPHTFNFKDLVTALAPSASITIGDTPDELAAFWMHALDGNNKPSAPEPDWNYVDSVFSTVDEPLAVTLNAIRTKLEE